MGLATSSNASSSFDSDEDGSSNIGVEFLTSVRDGRWDETLRLLEGDPTLLYVTDPLGYTALHVAASGRDPEFVSLLVKFVRKHAMRDVLVEQDSMGNTPLHLVAKNRQMNWSVFYLVKAKSDAVNVINEDGMSPEDLMQQAGARCDSMIYLELQSGYSDIEMEILNSAIQSDADEYDEDEDEDEEHKLSLAVKRGQEYLAQQILEKNRVLIWYKMGTALHDAAKAGHVGMLRLLVSSMTPYEMNYTLEGDKKDMYKSITPLYLALYKGHIDAARYLIQLSPKTAYQVNYWGDSPLHLAVQKGYRLLVRYIFQCLPASALPSSIKDHFFAAQKKKSKSSKSLANAAIKTTNLDILKAITKELPGLMDTPDYKGWRPLSYAAYTGFAEGVSYLLTKFPASVQEYDRDGSLPIHKAVGGGHVSVVKAFYLHSPQTLHGIDKNGQTILHLAVKWAKRAVLQYLTKDLEAEVKKIYNLRDGKGKTCVDLANEPK